MVPAEPCFGIFYLPPGIVRVLRYGGEPYGIDPQVTEKPFIDLAKDSFQVASVIIHFGKHFVRVNLPIVQRITVKETVNKNLVHDQGMLVFPVKSVGLGYRTAFFQRNQQVIGNAVIVYGPGPDPGTVLQSGKTG